MLVCSRFKGCAWEDVWGRLEGAAQRKTVAAEDT